MPSLMRDKIEMFASRCSRARISRLRRDTHSSHFDSISDDGWAASSAGKLAARRSSIGFASKYEIGATAAVRSA